MTRDNGMVNFPSAATTFGLTALIGLCLMASLAHSAAVADAGPSVTIPFSPVLAKSIRLHSEKHVTRVVGTVETAEGETTSDDELVFTERNNDGYILRWTNV